MGYKLKKQYRLGVANNCNYILSDQGDECVYLNPYVAFVLNRLFTGSSVEDIAGVLSTINGFSTEKANNIVLKSIKLVIKEKDKFGPTNFPNPTYIMRF